MLRSLSCERPSERFRRMSSGRVHLGAVRRREWRGPSTEFTRALRRLDRERERHYQQQRWTWFDDLLTCCGLTRRRSGRPCPRCGH